MIGRFAVGFAVVLAHSEAHAECAAPTPECHLSNGKKLIDSDPKRAAEELLASYKLDERTDTLTLYATALQRDKKYARALETWQRIITFREGEIETAKETIRSTSGRKREAARAKQTRAQEQSEAAAAEIIKLWASVGRVRLQNTAGLAVWHDGMEVDGTKNIYVNAGRDELVFTPVGGGKETRLVVEVAAGQVKTVQPPKAKQIQTASTKSEVPRAKADRPVAKLKPAKLELAPKSVIEQQEPELAATKFVDQPRSRTMSRVGLGLAAGGLVGVAVAGTVGYLAKRDFDDARDAGCNADGDCPVGRAFDLAERSNDRARIAQISAIGGGALLVTGATLYILGRGHGAKSRRAATDVALSVNSSSIAIGWSLK